MKALTAVRLAERVLCFGLLHHSHLHTIRDACYGLEEKQGAALIGRSRRPVLIIPRAREALAGRTPAVNLCCRRK